MYIYDDTGHRFLIIPTKQEFPNPDALQQTPPIVMGRKFIYRPADKSSAARSLAQLAENAELLSNTKLRVSDPKILINSAVGSQFFKMDDPRLMHDWRLSEVELRASNLLMTFVNLPKLYGEHKFVTNLLHLKDVIILHLEYWLAQKDNGMARSEHFICSTDPCTYLAHAKSFRVECHISQLPEHADTDDTDTDNTDADDTLRSSESTIICEDKYL